MPIFQYRFGEGAARARALIDAGITGRLFTASASTWWRRGKGYYAAPVVLRVGASASMYLPALLFLAGALLVAVCALMIVGQGLVRTGALEPLGRVLALLWRAGPARHADARYMAIDSGDLATSFEFRLLPDGTGHGTGPGGTRHERFRAWKEDLRDHG